MGNNTRIKNIKMKVAAITGGTRGIGLGIAIALAREGFHLVLNGMRPEEEVRNILSTVFPKTVQWAYCQGNIASASTHKKLIETARSTFGCLHILVNNAGIAPPSRDDILVASEENFDLVLETNLKGPYFLTQKIAHWMIEQKKDYPKDFFSIINISSVSATVASTQRGEYCISKAGIAMATKLWAARLGEYDIPVYEIQPGVIKTDMTAGVQAKYDALFASGITVQKRWGEPNDIGKVAAALAIHSLPYATGQVIQVDGGLTLQRL
jgi:3-oxoacyl-[acyl-carrier protein] reductase